MHLFCGGVRFTDSERENFGILVGGQGHITEEQKKKRTLLVGRPGPDATELPEPLFVDAFRHLYDADGPTGSEPTDGATSSESSSCKPSDKKRRWSFWSYRFQAKKKDNGWRLDYFIVSRQLAPKLLRCEPREDYYGLSDHCPLVLELKSNA